MIARLFLSLGLMAAIIAAPAAVTANDEEPVPVPYVEVIDCDAPEGAVCAMPMPIVEPMPIEGCMSPAFDPTNPAPSMDPGLCPEPVPGGCFADENGMTVCYDVPMPIDEPLTCSISSDGTSTCDDLPLPDRPLGAPIVTITVGETRYPVNGGHFLIADGVLSASVGCNSLFGEATIDDETITLGVIGMTEMYCFELNDAEQALVAVLSGANLRFADAATITSDAGSIALAVVDGELVAANRAEHGGGISWLALFLLFGPALAGLGAVAVGLSTRE